MHLPFDVRALGLVFPAFLGAAVLAGCSSEGPAPSVDPLASHCSRASSVACDSPAHRQDACVCDRDDECESGWCALEGKYCMTVCQWRSIAVDVGARCDCAGACKDGTRCLETCPTGAWCKELGSEHRCAPLGDEGSACLTWTPSCKPGLGCIASAGSTTGVCVRAILGDVGASCGEFPHLCADGLYCATSGTSATCQPLPIGVACSASVDCGGYGLYCSALDGKCRVQRAIGASCDPADSSDACAGNQLGHVKAHCDPAAKVCVGVLCG